MSYRGLRSGVYEGRNLQAPGMLRHGSLPRTDSSGQRSSQSHTLELAEKIAAQEAEIKRLDGENRRLASTQVVLRQELVDAQQEIQEVEALIRSIQTESDLQIRILLDKTANMELDIRSGPNLRTELQQAHAEAQSLVAVIQDLTTKTLIATRELEKANVDTKNLPELLAEHESLKQEQQMLRVTFEQEKSINVKEVKEMEEMEKDLVKMVREAEKLRLDLINVEQRARVPHGGGHPYSSQPPQQGIQPYGANHGISNFQTGEGIAGDNILPIGSSDGGAAPGGVNIAAQPMWGRT
uniref:Uncharacterized protein n=1 Tax=Kalanchoe fedtschenkoi TaxID=63787 RepID=A0A7N0RGN5_KALFE